MEIITNFTHQNFCAFNVLNANEASYNKLRIRTLLVIPQVTEEMSSIEQTGHGLNANITN